MDSRALTATLLATLLAAACSTDSGVVVKDDLSALPDSRSAETATPLDATSETAQAELVLPETDADMWLFEAVAETTEGPACQPGEGCFLDPCAGNEECLSGWCVGHMGEEVCTVQCESECPPGWSCQQIPGTAPDVVFVCISDHANLCLPCAAGNDCKGTAGEAAVCVDYGDEGSFCGGTCAADDDCPWGFSCLTTVTVDGIGTLQCVADAGVCPCTAKSVELALWTPCVKYGESGTCTGKRVCTADGLGECDAAEPTAEECDGLDNDCDGDIDEPTLIDDDYVSLCNDDNPCTKDSCLGANGCEAVALTEGECLDGNPCTVADHCEAGVCIGEAVDCDDDNPCTEDLCTETGGCDYLPAPGNCDDGNVCTLGDHCSDSQCVGEAVNCQCLTNDDCADLEDENLCNGTLYCDQSQVPYTCAVKEDSVVDCPLPTGPDAPCLARQCDADSGACSLVPAGDGAACDDLDSCSLGDTCADGACSGGPAANCNDGNLCTDDDCEPDVGCMHTNNQSPCNDGDVCTTEDLCDGGACQAGPALACDDGNLCNGPESCDADSGCVPGEPLLCNDDDLCNGLETCDPDIGCVAGQSLTCDDNNPCTQDSCQAGVGCHFVAADGVCSDGNECTVGDHCSNGNCIPAGLADCDDESVCTTDSCDPQSGCLHLLNNAPCDDGDLCTTKDGCSLGECVGTGELTCSDGNSCTADSCDPVAGCQFTPAEGECDDGIACTVDDYCAGGLCVAGGLLDCGDANPCTDDTCDFDAGCLHVNNQAPCSDGNICTTADTCANGTCNGTGNLDCDDNNPCTADACEQQTGCTHTPQDGNCNDANACTTVDACLNGTCMGSVAPDCDDDNVCTNDSCNENQGCINQDNVLPCDDDDQCTLNDICGNGTCAGPDPLDCDDSDECTTDSCEPDQGCVNVNVGACCGNGQVDEGEQCDDGNNVNNDVCGNDCLLNISPFKSYSKEGRNVYIFKSNSNAPLATYNNFCESQGLQWFVPKNASDGQYCITYCYNIDSYHTWIITKNNTSGSNWGGFNVAPALDSNNCGQCSNSGFSAIRKWSSSHCNPEDYGVTKCWDAGHQYDWLVCQDG